MEKPVYVFLGGANEGDERTLEDSPWYCYRYTDADNAWVNVNFNTVFDGTTPVTGTVVKKGSMYGTTYAGTIQFNSDRFKCFKGTIIVEDGIWKVQGPGQLGQSKYYEDGGACTVIVTNNASVVFDIPANTNAEFHTWFMLSGSGRNGQGSLRIESAGAGWYTFFKAGGWTVSGPELDTTIFIKAGVSVRSYYQTLNFNGRSFNIKAFGDDSGGREG